MAKEDSVKETNSGVKKKGNWKDIAEFGEEVEKALDGAEKDSIKKFGKWRPKVEESESDVKKKTVEEAVLPENRLEKESDGMKEDLKEASGKMAKAGKKASQKKVPDKEIIKASEEAAKPFYSNIAAAIRKIEHTIYSWITLRFNPYYLDTQDFSVDMEQKEPGEFEMDVAVIEDDKRDELKKNLIEEE